jgi:hypothetical protein
LTLRPSVLANELSDGPSAFFLSLNPPLVNTLDAATPLYPINFRLTGGVLLGCAK